MAKIFLRSGNLDAILALGENGQPVYLSALQLRETLRLKKQPQVADCLAIPQANDAGDRLDWYSPIEGKVTSWAAASSSARSAALNQLLACQNTLTDISEKAQRSEKPSQKLFGALLSKALQFPDQNYVYLVGGQPVITFWGFVSLDKKSRQDVFDCLHIEEEDAVPPSVLSRQPSAPQTPPAVASSVSPVIAPLLAPETTAPASPPVPPVAVAVPVPALKIIDEPESAAKPAPETSAEAAKPKAKIWLRYSWVLPAAALLITFGVQLNNRSDLPASPSQDAPVASQKAAEPAVQPVARSGADTPAAVKTTTLPLAAAVVAPSPPAAEPAAAPTPDAAAPVRPAGKDELVMPQDAVKIGSTKFLNGSWRVLVQLKNPLTGKLPMLKYQLQNGKGSARITQGDGVSCRVDVFAGLMKSGNLVINSRTKARCSDGSRYQIPEVVCKQGLTGAAECSARYNDETVLPMTMKRESKS